MMMIIITSDGDCSGSSSSSKSNNSSSSSSKKCSHQFSKLCQPISTCATSCFLCVTEAGLEESQ